MEYLKYFFVEGFLDLWVDLSIVDIILLRVFKIFVGVRLSLLSMI